MPTFFNKYHPVRKIFFFLGEGVLIFSSVLGILIVFSSWDSFLVTPSEYTLRSMTVTLVFQLSLYFYDLYDLRKPGTTTDTFIRMMQAFGVGCIVLALLYTLFPSIIISTFIFWACYLIICASLLAWRSLYYLVLEKKLFASEILIVGMGEMAEKIATEIKNNRESGFVIAALVGSGPPTFDHADIPVLANLAEMNNEPRLSSVERIVVALDDRRGTMPIAELLHNKLRGLLIEDGISFYEAITGKILVEKVNPAWLIFSEGFDCGRMTYLIKRLLDLSLAVVGLCLSLPITLITAILIKLESPGPIFYRQERVGERGKVFSIIKFRSMRQDAEKNGAVWAKKNDSRVTRVGGFIRKVRIDEIPQMWNVIRGQMSFVGPRPERPVFVEQLVEKLPYYSLRHAAKPGITGWAQVCYPYGASEEDALRKLEYDLYYIKHQSIFIDLLIIFRTIKTVLFQKGSR
ncbi:sugar transferase, PEP-CTERM system associated [Desulfobulbus propionicus DSM 2032]|jgi:sugar transferase (PEP-CTERM system associated)|uniref:Sugar transferase, PEP-CTERM system associated n=1 Tax=Desulfobulbus propionicus (strain ATCC 33891 / DSM 2032 / VKM B-1956 / 1pr3) TaxID=577650 RepID=A0A7U3YJK4_DESPD|nr:TIGR03013 family XrtA/PEP-CTERM system glycosyltransferase [Desulfobulbus propionicus]ADW16510.1 sugar transferase, PEP-CTERM system associated [Desulfobulbus propionicus DSM 2032]